MESYKFTQSKYNTALFYNKKKNLYITIYINNFKIYCKSKRVIKNFKDYFHMKYKIKDLKYTLYYLRMKI